MNNFLNGGQFQGLVLPCLSGIMQTHQQGHPPQRRFVLQAGPQEVLGCVLANRSVQLPGNSEAKRCCRSAFKAVLQVRSQLLPAANRIHRLLKQGNRLCKIVRRLLVHRFQNLYAEFGLSRSEFQCAQGQGGTHAGPIVAKSIGE